jgi:DNA ligase (NAD+)
LEDETGLGVMATRFGGRVGRTYGDLRDEGGVDDDDGQHDAIGVGGGENDHESDSGMVKKTNVSKSTKSLRSGGGRRIKRRHLPNAPMLSLDNAMDDDEALAWLNRMRRLILSSSPIAKEEEEDDDGVIGDSEFSIASTTTTTRATRTMRILAEPKIDGLGLSLRYVLDKSRSSLGVDDVYDFAWGATRGDGTRGEDVTEAVRSSWMTGGTDDEEEDADVDGEKDLAAAHERVDEPADEDDRSFSVPRTLAIPRGVGGLGRIDSPPPDAIEIRGEVVLPRRAFEEFVGSDGGDDGRMDEASSSGKSLRTTAFSNARNAASGILLRSRDPPDSADAIRTKFLRSRLQFYAYDLVASSASLSSSSLASSLDEGGEKEDASNDSSSLSWPSTVMGDDGLQMRDALTRLGFHVPSPIAMESIDVAPDVELNIADVPNLLNYHRNLMVNREGGDDDDDEATRYDDKARVREANDSTTRTAFPYQIDGVVYKLSSFDDRRICGSSSRAPRWAMAHKFPPTRAVTRLLDIEVQVGRTGSLTPVAILEPVYINGVSVSRATLHNFHHARKLLLPNRATDHISVDIGLVSKSIGVKKGISLLVGRAGDVIPQVKKRVFDDELDDSVESANETITLEDPLVCPACGSSTSFDFVRVPMKGRGVNSKSEENDETLKIKSNDEEGVVNPKGGQVLRCSGPQLLCQPRAVNGLVHAYSRAGLNVNGLSKARISHLMEEGIIRFPSDLFALYGGTKGKASSERDGKLVPESYNTAFRLIELLFSVFFLQTRRTGL